MKTCKILTFISSVFLFLSLFIITKTPSYDGFELSIYYAYPFYFWVFFIGGYLSSSLALYSISITNEKMVKWSIFSTISLIFYTTILIALPTLRGYPFAGAQDTNAHVYYVTKILKSNHISSNDFYPATHLLFSSSNLLTNLRWGALTVFFSIAFLITFIGGTFKLLSQIVSELDKKRLMSVLSFSIIPPILYFSGAVFSNPARSSIMFLPLILFCFEKSNFDSRYTSLFLILILFMVFLHPITTGFIIVVLFFLGTITLLTRLISKQNTNKAGKKYFWGGILITCIWVINYIRIILFKSLTVYKFLVGKGGPSSQLGDYQIKYSLIINAATFFTTIRVFLFRYLVIIAIFLYIIILSIFYLHNSKKSLDKEKLYLLLFPLSILIAIFLFFVPFGEHSISRISRLFIGFSPLFIFILHNKFNFDLKKSKNLFRNFNIISVITVFLISIIIIIGSLTFVATPLTFSHNTIPTHSELKNTEWMMENQNRDYPIKYNRMRVEDYQLLFLNQDNKNLTRLSIAYNHYFPPNLGYGQNCLENKSLIEKKVYLATSIRDIKYSLIYTKEVRPYVDLTYNQTDLDNLSNEQRVNKIYTTNTTSIWLTEVKK